jgi:hypothetical protein
MAVRGDDRRTDFGDTVLHGSMVGVPSLHKRHSL